MKGFPSYDPDRALCPAVLECLVPLGRSMSWDVDISKGFCSPGFSLPVHTGKMSLYNNADVGS